MADPDTFRFSSSKGGPLRAFLVSTGRVRPEGRAILDSSLVVLSIAWIPMIVIAFVQQVLTRAVDPTMRDLPLHVRFLIAVPLLFLAEALLDERCDIAVDQFLAGRFCERQDAVTRVLREAEHLRNAAVPEAIMLLVALAAGQATLWGVIGPMGLLEGARLPPGLSAARVWYAAIGLPLFVFLELRLLYRWGLWTRVLWGLSQADPKPVATHPDHAGGLAQLALPTAGFAAFVLSGSAVMAATWAREVRAGTVDLKSFTPSFLVLVAVALVLALGPLLFFSRCLLTARIEGICQYTRLGLVYGRRFTEKWSTRNKKIDDSFLGSNDISGLADIGTSFENLSRMRLVPFSSRAILIVLAAALAPMLPLMLLQVPLSDLLRRLGGAVLGGLPP
jgi:hypothetical protein